MILERKILQRTQSHILLNFYYFFPILHSDFLFQGAQLTDGEVHNSFDQLPQQSLDSMLLGKTAANVSFYDDTALCASAFRSVPWFTV